MPSFEEHIMQVNRNLNFLTNINNSVNDCFDWQITVCFYSALHTVNAHLSKFDLQYRKHSDVNHAINPFTLSPGRLPEEIYIAYMSLQSLSRRSRYLVNEKDKNLKSDQAFLIFEKHIAKGFRHLDLLLNYFNVRYKLNMQSGLLKCSEIKRKEDFSVLQFH